MVETFARNWTSIIENALDTWTYETLDQEIRRDFGDGNTAVTTRARETQGSFAHDVYHIAELNEMLAGIGLPLVDLWSV